METLPMAISDGFHVASCSPLGGGLLTDKYAAEAGGCFADAKMYKARYGVDGMHEAARELSELAAEVGVHPATLAVALVARNPGITHPIISARSVEQFQPSLDAIPYDLSKQYITGSPRLTRLKTRFPSRQRKSKT